jgi:hypothetical protein
MFVARRISAAVAEQHARTLAQCLVALLELNCLVGLFGTRERGLKTMGG